MSQELTRRTGRPRSDDAFLGPDVIADAARVIASTQGLGALTMRSLAAHLGCTPRALYRYVTDKAAVLELLADSALAELTEARSDLPWDEALLDFFAGFRKLLLTQPDTALIIAQQTVTGPNFRRHADRATGVMLAAGFSAEIAAEAVVALAYYTLGASVPGTGQPLHDQWRRLDSDLSAPALPALAEVGPLFAHDRAGPRFHNALRRLIGGYAAVPAAEGGARR